MDDHWALLQHEWNYPYAPPCCQDPRQFQPPAPPPHHILPHHYQLPPPPKCDNPREIRNKAEKQRRDKLNKSVAELASMVPPVMATSRRIDKTGVLRLTAHYLRSHQYVFGESIGQHPEFSGESALSLLSALKGFLVTVTYKGLFVVVSQNVHEYIGYTEMDLLGNNILNLVHEDDREILRNELMPTATDLLGPNGELIVPDDPSGVEKVKEILAKDKRNFVIRLKKLTQRSEPIQYLTCVIEGSFRKSDSACRGNTKCCQMVRRARARGENPCSSGNDIVFIGVVRPTVETFRNESNMEVWRMEYRTRHSVDGEIIQAEQKIALVTGYIPHEVYGLNAMNFMHRDDVRWVIIALREMYDTQCLVGESCYRLMAKNGAFIFLRTLGQLEVEASSGAVTTFVCTNTLVDEAEGMHLINMMKKKFTVMINNNEVAEPEESTSKSDSEDHVVKVEDPRNIEKVILHLVTNLPSPEAVMCSPRSSTSEDRSSPNPRLFIIPPRKERIVSSIEKIYNVIKDFDNSPKVSEVPKENESYCNKEKITNVKQTNNDIADDILGTTLNNTYNGESVGKISDQVLTAVQLRDRDAGTSFGNQIMGTKRSFDRVDDDYMFKRQLLHTDEPKVEEIDDQNNIEDFDSDCIENLLSDSELDNALNILQAMDSPIPNPETFPELLYDPDFQNFFGNMENPNVDEAPKDESSFKH